MGGILDHLAHSPAIGDVQEHAQLARTFAECDAKLQALLAERSRSSVDLGKTPKAGSKTRASFDVRKALADWAGLDLNPASTAWRSPR